MKIFIVYENDNAGVIYPHVTKTKGRDKEGTYLQTHEYYKVWHASICERLSGKRGWPLRGPERKPIANWYK
jgi:hypothetical protein